MMMMTSWCTEGNHFINHNQTLHRKKKLYTTITPLIMQRDNVEQTRLDLMSKN